MKNETDEIKPRSVKFRDSEFEGVHAAAKIKNVSPHKLMRVAILEYVKRILNKS